MYRRKRLRVVSKTRFITFITILIIFLGTITGGILKFDRAYSTTYIKWEEVVVRSGDTLWNIAKANNPKNYDVRKVIYEIMEFNNMKDARINPGDIIKIPMQ